MSYTNNLNLQNAEYPSTSSANTLNTTPTVFPMFNKNMQLLDSYIAGYYTYNISSDSNISITTDSIVITITDTGTILTTSKTLTINSTSDIQIQIIKNETNYTLQYGSIDILSGKTEVIHNNISISSIGSVYMQDIYSYTSGLPAINTILVSKRLINNSILSGGSAKANIAATNNTTIDIWLSGSKVGYIKFPSGGTIGVVTLFGIIYVHSADTLYIKTQSIQDATLSGIGIVLNIIGE